MTSPMRHERARNGIRLVGAVFEHIEKFVVVLFLIGITVLIFSGVLSRFVFHYSIAFTEELARFLFVWGSLLGAAAALKSGEHGGVPLLANRFSPRWQRFVEIFVAIGVTGFMVYLVFMTGASTIKSFQSGQISTTTEIPVWTINLGMMLAFLAGVVRCVQGFMRGAFRPQPPETLPVD